MTPVLVVCASAVLLLAWVLRKKPHLTQDNIPLPAVCAIIVMVGAIVVGAMATSGSQPRRMSGGEATVSQPAAATGHALPAGAKAPKIKAAGWVNGAPKTASGIRVIDVWAPWCLVCSDMAPGMVDVHRRFSSRGVQFISLTDMSKVAVDGFVDHFDIPWSSGYGAPRETISAFRALREGVTDPQRMVSPTLYIVDAKGVVLWTDDAGRYRHENVGDLLAELASELDKALSASKESPTLSRSEDRYAPPRSSS